MTGENVRANGAARWHTTLESGSFEETLECLEEVVAKLEAGQLSLAESLDYYDLGIQLTKRCEEILAEAELRVSHLTVNDKAAVSVADGSGITEDNDGPDEPTF